MSQDDRLLYAYELGHTADMPIHSGELDRAWMDGTDQRAAYRCLPLTIANQSGWVIPCPSAFTASWDGGPWKTSVRIDFDPPPGAAAPPNPFGFNVVSFAAPAPVHRDDRITSHFGSGVVTFSIPYLFRTPPGINLWVKGPANWFKDGASPLEGVVETDWLPSTFTMNWKLTRPHYPVRFERGDPICMVVPVPRGLAERLRPVYTPLSAAPELEAEFRAWEQSRADFNAALETGDPEATRRGWQRDYVKGLTPRGNRATEHQTRVQLREFTKEGGGNRE